MELSKVRSVLCVPGHRLDYAAKCRSYGADQVLWDLEDSVPVNLKAAARRVVAEHIRPGDAVRVNELSVLHEVELDFEMLSDLSGDLVVWIPKAGEDVLSFAAPLSFTTSLVLCVESPWAVFFLRDLLDAQGWDGIAWGRHDYVAEVGLRAQAVDHAADQVALAARACGLPSWAAPSYVGGDFARENAQQAAYSAYGRGFTGMGCIAPWQVPLVNAAFQPPLHEVQRAERLLAAAAESSEAVFRTEDGDLVSPPTLRWARRVLGA